MNLKYRLFSLFTMAASTMFSGFSVAEVSVDLKSRVVLDKPLEFQFPEMVRENLQVQLGSEETKAMYNYLLSCRPIQDLDKQSWPKKERERWMRGLKSLARKMGECHPEQYVRAQLSDGACIVRVKKGLRNQQRLTLNPQTTGWKPGELSFLNWELKPDPLETALELKPSVDSTLPSVEVTYSPESFQVSKTEAPKYLSKCLEKFGFRSVRDENVKAENTGGSSAFGSEVRAGQ